MASSSWHWPLLGPFAEPFVYCAFKREAVYAPGTIVAVGRGRKKGFLVRVRLKEYSMSYASTLSYPAWLQAGSPAIWNMYREGAASKV